VDGAGGTGCGAGAGGEARAAAGDDGPPELRENAIPASGLARVLAQEIAHVKGNSIRGLRRGFGDRRRRLAARGGAERR
jgi:hypothetical protein